MSLYKALLSTRDTAVGDMAAASERVEEYRSSAASFCKRVADFLGVMFRFQVSLLSHPLSLAESLIIPSFSAASFPRSFPLPCRTQPEG